MTHGWLHHVKVTFEVTQTCCITDAMFAARGWPPLPLSQLLSCLPHLCQTPELFVMDDLVIKWERCWVSDRSLRSTWPSVIPFPFHTNSCEHTHNARTLMHTHTQTLMHTCTGQHSVRVFWSLFLHTHTRLHTSNRHSATHTICMLSYPLLLSPLFFLLTYLIPDVSSSLT